MEHGDDWKVIQELIGFKNKREVILEFLRAPINEIKSEDHQYMKIHNY